REWLARALRAPRDRAWIADGYVSDRWLPVSPVTGAVDAFEWKAPVDAIGRGDQRLVIEERPEPPMKEIKAAPKALPSAEPVEPEEPEEKEPETVVEEVQAQAPPPPVKKETPVQPEERPRPRLFVPDRPPDDPGVAEAEADDNPSSLERLRAAQIR
ncbi:MAG: heme biosynthesis protein HemY, partial [Actinomycetota bacterium]